MKTPLVSVILPVYNSELYIYDALESIVNQSYRNLEILVILNGTTDNSLLEINKVKDNRIKLINISESIGLIKSLNIGLSESKGKYIARMDADDIAYPQRIEKQIEYLESHDEVGLCATWYKTFDGTNLIGKNKIKDQDIKIQLLHQCHICHPTVIIRKSIIEEHSLRYADKFPHSEDYALWIEMVDKTNLYTYPEILLQYRDHENNISKLENDTQSKLSIEVKKWYFSKIGSTLTKDEIVLYTKFSYSDFTLTEKEIQVINKIIARVIDNNSNIISSEKLKEYLSNKWNNLILNSSCNKKLLYKIHSKSYTGIKLNSWNENLKINLKLIGKGIIKNKKH